MGLLDCSASPGAVCTVSGGNQKTSVAESFLTAVMLSATVLPGLRGAALACLLLAGEVSVWAGSDVGQLCLLDLCSELWTEQRP